MNAHELRLAVIDAGLADPTLTREGRRAGVRTVAQASKVSEATVYRALAKLRQGEPARKPRADRGRSRTWPEGAVEALRELVAECAAVPPPCVLQAALQAEFPGSRLSLKSVSAQARRLAREIHGDSTLPPLRWDADHIKRLSTLTGVRPSAIADAIGVSGGELQRVFEGRYVLPATLLPPLAAILGVGVEDLFSEEVAVRG